MTTATPAHRRHSLLATLYFETASTARVGALVRQMEVVHNIVASTDLVRADLMWLQEVELVRLKDDVASLTERGRDVATGRAVFPGGAL
ncbi:MAG: hypothetical protein U1E02_28150 [Hydrogenophaga sp.]|nr:hypothetical protein [Hydrogenophaga sp.]MDZ4128008.1 hypothetical protein [Hydrogenophaga sp.]